MLTIGSIRAVQSVLQQAGLDLMGVAPCLFGAAPNAMRAGSCAKLGRGRSEPASMTRSRAEAGAAPRRRNPHGAG